MRRGFGTHSQREFEIFSYVHSGELEQYVFWSIYPVHISYARTNLSKDSMGNTEILKRVTINSSPPALVYPTPKMHVEATFC